MTQIDRRWVATAFGGPDVLRFEEFDVAEPGPGEVTIRVRAAGVNPADYKHVARGMDSALLPLHVGYEVAGVISATGPHSNLTVGTEVLAYRVSSGWATSVTAAERDVFRKPEALGFAEAANLLLAGSTAREMLYLAGVGADDTVLIHGASGAVGISAVQQARLLGARVIGTTSAANRELVERFGAEPVAYGEGLEGRVQSLAPVGITAALDTVGTEEAITVSLDLVADRRRIVTVVVPDIARRDGFRAITAPTSEDALRRDAGRAALVELAGAGLLAVPVARTFALADARAAVELLQARHPGGKFALIP